MKIAKNELVLWGSHAFCLENIPTFPHLVPDPTPPFLLIPRLSILLLLNPWRSFHVSQVFFNVSPSIVVWQNYQWLHSQRNCLSLPQLLATTHSSMAWSEISCPTTISMLRSGAICTCAGLIMLAHLLWTHTEAVSRIQKTLLPCSHSSPLPLPFCLPCLCYYSWAFWRC